MLIGANVLRGISRREKASTADRADEGRHFRSKKTKGIFIIFFIYFF